MQRTFGTNRVRPTLRRGAVAPLLAILLIPLLGMIAFSVDLGYMIVVRTELQNAADAAAMAGAEQLMEPYARFYAPGQTVAQQLLIYLDAVAMAKATAKAVSVMNTAGGANINLQDGDVKVGFYDGTTFTASPALWLPGTNFPNSVQVLARRDNTGGSTSNGPVPLFFAPVFGMQTTNQQAFAQASTYTVANITGFQNVSNLGVGMIPATLDVVTWRDYLNDGIIESLGKQGQASTGLDQQADNALQVYGSIKGNGNFGSLPLDGQHTGNLASQITSGMTQGMYQTLLSHNNDTSTPLVPLAPWDMNTLAPVGGSVPSGSHDPNVLVTNPPQSGSWNWQGDPGFRSTDASTLNANPGVYLLPLYKAYDNGAVSGNYQACPGQGSNYFYNIVDFVPVQITFVSGQQNNRDVWIKPAAMVLDFNQVVGGTPQLAGPPSSWSTYSPIFTAPRLSQ
jgi:Flp pilus assembly protein TadG